MSASLLVVYCALPTLLGFTASSALAQATTSVATDAPVLPSLQLRLSASRQQFHAGQPILLKVELENLTSEQFSVLQLTPWDASTLVVLKNGTVPVIPSNPLAPYHRKFPTDQPVRPGASYVYAWKDVLNPLAFWGYDLLPPGRYVIYAQPKIVGGIQRNKWYFADKRLRSNAVTIEVLP